MDTTPSGAPSSRSSSVSGFRPFIARTSINKNRSRNARKPFCFALMASYFLCSCKESNQRNTPPALVLRIPSAIFAANGSSRLAIRARRDSIGRPWPIDPTSEAGFGELKGGILQHLATGGPFRLAEVFGFGRANRAWTPDLALSSPDGESRRPVGKDECLGNPKGKPAGGAFSFGYFSLGKQRKVTRPAGRNKMLTLSSSSHTNIVCYSNPSLFTLFIP